MLIEFINLDLLVLHVDEVIGDGSGASGLLGEGEEPEPAALLLLLFIEEVSITIISTSSRLLN